MHTSDVQPLIEAVWQYCQAEHWQEAYELMNEEGLFYCLRLWGANTLLLELCQLLLSKNWQFTPGDMAVIYSYIASTSGVLGQKTEALKYYERALLIRREVGERGGEGRTLNNLGRVYNALGQQAKAIEYCERALYLAKEVGDRGGEGRTLHNIGMIYAYAAKPRYDVALACVLLAKNLLNEYRVPRMLKMKCNGWRICVRELVRNATLHCWHRLSHVRSRLWSRR